MHEDIEETSDSDLGKGALEVRIIHRLKRRGIEGRARGTGGWGHIEGWGTKEPVLGSCRHTPGSWIPEGWVLRCLSRTGVYPRSLIFRETGGQDRCDSGGHLGSSCHNPACSLSLPHHLLHVSEGSALSEGLLRLGDPKNLPNSKPRAEETWGSDAARGDTICPSGIRNLPPDIETGSGLFPNAVPTVREQRTCILLLVSVARWQPSCPASVSHHSRLPAASSQAERL